MIKEKSNSLFNITTTFMVVVVFFIVVSCGGKDIEKTSAIKDRTKLPKLKASEITTVISDSGITRYRISTPTWEVFDRASQPYWEFKDGIHLERFDESLKVDANIHSKYAKYLQNEKLWLLKGDVKMTNIKGELFETERLYWSQYEEKLYSDTIVKITQQAYIIHAVGFVSNQQMTKYEFRGTKGVFPVEDK